MNTDSSTEVLISFTDLLAKFKTFKKKGFFFSLILGLVCLTYGLFRPLTYQAQGTFKLAGATSSAFATTLSSLMGTEKSITSSHDDPKTLLLSFPVLEKVIKKLNLQAHLVIKERFSGFTAWNNLKLECFLAQLQSKASCSPLIPPGVILASSSLFPEKNLPISCKELRYTGELLTTLRLVFLDEQRFAVFANNKKLGEGQLGAPFLFSEGAFTLESYAKTEELTLILMPLDSVVEGLKRGLKVRKNKQRPSLLNITYKHPNRQIATEIVNTLMNSYQEFIQELGTEKVQKQLHYLSQRKADYLKEMDLAMVEQQVYLAHHVGEGGFLNFEQEASFMMQNKEKILKEQELLRYRLEKLRENLSGSEDMGKKGNYSFFDRKSVEEQLTQYEKESEALEVKKSSYLRALEQKEHPCASVIEESSLSALYQQIEELEAHMNDEKNYSTKERDFFSQELKTKRERLKQRLHDLFAKATVHNQLLQEKICTLQKAERILLHQEGQWLEKQLQALATQEKAFPEKWLNEKKINLQVELIISLIEQISKAIEGRNIALHMETLDSYPLEYASLPLLPQPPHLYFFFLGGSGAGFFLFLGWLFFSHLGEGASASLANLKEQGRLCLGVWPNDEMVTDLFFSLAQKPHATILLAGMTAPFREALFAKFPRGTIFHFTEAIESPDKFKQQLHKLKERYEWIFIENKSRHLFALVDSVVYGITQESLKEVASLPSHTLFVHFSQKANSTLWDFLKREKRFYLQELKPFLDKVKPPSFSS